MTTELNITLKNAPKIVANNLEIWAEIWNSRCELIEKFQEETYSRHILLVIPDLIEEIEFNADRLIKNEYARKFFHQCLSIYEIRNTINQKPNAAQMLADRIRDKLSFVIESLFCDDIDNSFQLSHLLPILRSIDKEMTASEVLDRSIEILLEILSGENQITKGNAEVIFLTDTIILLFWRNGRFPSSIEYLASNILDSIHGPNDKGKYYSSYPGAPEKGENSDEEFGKLLNDFFDSLSIRDRINEIRHSFQYQSREYKVIFRVLGFEDNIPAFDIGNVQIYNPRIEKQIKIPAMEGLRVDFAGIEKTETPGHCIAVKMQGVDSTSMKLIARQTAERSLAFLMKRGKRAQPFNLSDNYSICDMNGKELAWGHNRRSSEWLTGIWKEVTETDRVRFGQWMSNESAVPAIQRWLSSMDWHRQAVECQQSTQELLNAWFAVEHLFDESCRLSLRVPEFLRHRPNEKRRQCLWHPKKSVSFIQFIVSLIELKYELTKYADEICGNFIPNSLMEVFHHYKLPEQLMIRFCEPNRRAFYTGKFIELLDDITTDMKAKGRVELVDQVEDLRKLFYDSDYCRNKTATEFWRIKDDIYNIYRIRNMLVHRAATQSKLVEYYSARAREYSFALLYELKWIFLRTKNDSEILTLDEYYQELVIDANIGLEGLQKGNMNKLRKWIFK